VAFTLSGNWGTNSSVVLTALAKAAAAAAAAGRPLQLHTLRVLGDVDGPTVSQLLGSLPHLRCLQLGLSPSMGLDRLQQHFAPLQRATQLEELYLVPPGYLGGESWMPALLPPNLRRLSWVYNPQHDFSHLTKCTFLHLIRGLTGGRSIKPPPGLQQLELFTSNLSLSMVEEQKEVVTSWGRVYLDNPRVQQLLARLPKLSSASVFGSNLCTPANQAALKQASQLSALTVDVDGGSRSELQQVRAAVVTAASMHALRRLHLRGDSVLEQLGAQGLAGCTQLTQLRVSSDCLKRIGERQQATWVAEVGRLQGLRWLSVPGVLLGAKWRWLGRLQQLQVLVVQCREWGVVQQPCRPSCSCWVRAA
jgi:hypothetical protein